MHGSMGVKKERTNQPDTKKKETNEKREKLLKALGRGRRGVERRIDKMEKLNETEVTVIYLPLLNLIETLSNI